MKIERCVNNPLLTPADVKPSRQDFKVDGVFNCGVTEYKGEVILLCRVAESVICKNEDEVCVPIVKKVDGKDEIQVITYRKSECPQLDFSDTRHVSKRGKNKSNILNLTSLSHLRIARSKDGIHFEIDEHPAIFPLAEEESWGMEDPRITKIDDTYYINYTSVTENGAGTSLISTKDFCKFERHGIIFAPENKDVTIFPRKINGKYVAFNRPVPSGIGNPQMWIAKSPDLIHWGEQRHFCGISSDTESWDDGRIGGGAVPFLTKKGWVKIYHAADRNDRYCLDAFLLDEKDPSIVLAKTKDPILEPKEEYEKKGFFGEVVFTCGCLVKDNKVIIYYGAADDKICRADFELDDLFATMEYVDIKKK